MLPKSASGLNRRSLEGLTRYGKRHPRIQPKNLDRGQYRQAAGVLAEEIELLGRTAAL